MWNRKKISEFTPFKSYSHILSDRLTPSVCPTETCPQLAPEHQDLPLAQRHPGPAAASAQGGALHHPTAGGWPHPHGSPPLREPDTREISFSTCCMLVSRALMRTLFIAARGFSRPFFLLEKRGAPDICRHEVRVQNQENDSQWEILTKQLKLGPTSHTFR